MVKDKFSRSPVSQQPHIIKYDEKGGIGSIVEVEINGRKIKVQMGTTILEACKQNNIHIPTLCYHEDLCLAGLCRICVVEIEGMKTLQASCTYPITNRLKILTSSEKVRKARRHIICTSR